tara:strand:- start:9088 stop:14076 length:4989 start_codon:yes stop_codon:yes gene_type:complete
MGVGSSRNDRMFVVDKKVRPILQRLNASFNKTASHLKTILDKEIQLIKNINTTDKKALSKALDTLIVLREQSVMYRVRIRKMIPLTNSHRLVLKDLRRYLRRIRYHTSKIGRLLGKSNKKFNAYIEKLPNDIVPIRKTRKIQKRFTKPITKAGLVSRMNNLPKIKGNEPYVEVVTNVEPQNKEALIEMSQVVDELEERNSENNTSVKMARVKSKEMTRIKEIQSLERIERNKIGLERQKNSSEQRKEDRNRGLQTNIERRKALVVDRERRNVRDKESANRRFQANIERQKVRSSERERRNVRDKESANRRLEFQKQREELSSRKEKDLADRRLQEKKLSLEEAKQKRLNKQRVVTESREKRLRGKENMQSVRSMEQRIERDSPVSRPMSRGSIPSQQIFVGSQPKESQNTNLKTLGMRLKQETSLESEKDKIKLEKMSLEMRAKSNREKLKLEKQKQKREETETKQKFELERMRIKSNERQKKSKRKAESLDKKTEASKEKRESLISEKKIKSNEKLSLKNKALAKGEAIEKRRQAKKEEEKEALLAKQSRKNALRSQKIENNERKEKAQKEKNTERKQNEGEKERKKSEKEGKKEYQNELFGKLLGIYTSWKVNEKDDLTFKNKNALSKQDINAVDTLVKNTNVKTFARRKIAGFTPSIFAKYKPLHKDVAVAYLKSSSSKNKEKEIKQKKKNTEDVAVKEKEAGAETDFIAKINDLSIDDLKDVRAYLLAWRPNIITKKPRIVSHVLSGGVKTSVAQQIIKDVIPKNDVIYEWYKIYSRNTRISTKSKLRGDSWGPLPEETYSTIRETYINVFKKIKTDINDVKNDKGYNDVKRKWFGKNTSNVKKSIEDLDGIQEYIIDKELAVLSDKMKCGEITGFKGELHANFKRFMNTNKKIANIDKQNAFDAVKQFLNDIDIEKLYIITTKRPKKIDTLNETEGCILRNYLDAHFFTADAAYKMYIGNNKNDSSVFSTVVTNMKNDIDAYLGNVSLEELYEIRRDTGTMYNGKSRKDLTKIGTFKAKVVSIFIKNNIILKLDDALEKIGNLKVHEKLRQAFSVFKGKYEKLKDNPFYKQIVGQVLGFDVKIELPKFMVSKGASIKMNAPKPPTLRSSKRFILKISDVAIPRLQAGKLAKLKIPQTSKMTISLPKTTHIIIPKTTVIQLKSSTKRPLLSIPRPSSAKYYSINGRVMPIILNVPIKLPTLRSSQSFSLSFHPETPKLTPSMATLKVPENENMTSPSSLLPPQQENEINTAGEQLAYNMEKIQRNNIIGRIKTMRSELRVLEGNKLDLNVNTIKLKNIEKMYLERMKLKRKQTLTGSENPANLQAKEFTTEELEYINTGNGNFTNLEDKRKIRSSMKTRISKVEQKLSINKENVLKAQVYSGTHEEILSKFVKYLSNRQKELEQGSKNPINNHQSMDFMKKLTKQMSPETTESSPESAKLDPIEGARTMTNNPLNNQGKVVENPESVVSKQRNPETTESSPESASGTATLPLLKIKGENVKKSLEIHLEDTKLNRISNKDQLDKLRTRFLTFIDEQTIPQNKIVLSSNEILNIKSSGMINSSLQKMYKQRKEILDKLSNTNKALLWDKAKNEYHEMTGKSHEQILSFLNNKLREINNLQQKNTVSRRTISSQGGNGTAKRSFIGSLNPPSSIGSFKKA